MTAMPRRAVVCAGEFKQQEVVNLMWALATLGVEPGAELLTVMPRRAVVCAGEFKQQEKTNLMWALAVISCEDCLTVWEFAISHLMPVPRWNPGPAQVALGAAVSAELAQLHQVLLCVALEGLWPELGLVALHGGTLSAGL